MSTSHRKYASDTLRITPLQGGQMSWSVTHDTEHRARRFQAFQQFVVTAQPATTGLLAARLVGLDAVSPHNIKDLESASAVLCRIGSEAAVQWHASDPIRVERRLVSSITLLCWAALHGGLLRPLSDMKESLRDYLSETPLYQGHDDPTKVLTEDQMCWFQEQAPGTLVMHLAGQSTLSALPLSAWARLEAGRPLKMQDGFEISDLGATSVIIEAVHETESDNFSMLAVHQAEDIFKSATRSTIDGYIKRAWAQALCDLEGRLRRTHPAVGIVVGWAAHLCEAGTVDSSNPAAKTVKRYALLALTPLAKQLHQLPTDIDTWGEGKLSLVFENVLKGTSPGVRGQMSAAIASFQAFLEEWFGIPVMSRISGEWTPPSPPASANVLWDHEIDRCIELCVQPEDFRLANNAAACFWIARENPVRMQDLLRLRLQSFHLYRDALGPALEIEVARDASRGRLKTETSQRRLLVRDRHGIEHLSCLIRTRREEAAPEQALLFGQVGDDRANYRQAAMHTYVNALVKRATGDPGMRFHHLRHGVISRRVHSILSSLSVGDVNPLEVVAADAGHATPYTTLHSYSHCYEHSLRMWLDIALEAGLRFTAEQAQDWLQAKPNTLVQAARRGNVSLFVHVRRRLDDLAKKLPLTPVKDLFQWGEVAAPKIPRPSITLTPATVADALLRYSKGQPILRLASMLNMTGLQVEQGMAQLTSWMNEVLSRFFPRKHFGSSTEDMAALIAMLGADAERMFSDRLVWLREYLSKPVSPEELASTVTAWISTGKGNYIDLSSRTRPRYLFRLLSASGVPPSAVRIVVGCASDTSPVSDARAIGSPNVDLARRLAHSAVAVFVEEFGCQPLVESRAQRADRPDVYLLISHQATADVTSSAAAVNGVLKAWLIACQAYLIFLDILQKKHEQHS